MERHKVLASMLALDQFRGSFTASELATYSGVREATVHSVIHREKHRLEEVERAPTGRPGGQVIRHRLKPGAAERLEVELQASVGRVQLLAGYPRDGSSMPVRFTAVSDSPRQRPTRRGLPVGLVAAEDTLVRLLPNAATAVEREQLIRLAELNIEAEDKRARLDPDNAAWSPEVNAYGTVLKRALVANKEAVEASRPIPDGELYVTGITLQALRKSISAKGTAMPRGVVVIDAIASSPDPLTPFVYDALGSYIVAKRTCPAVTPDRGDSPEPSARDEQTRGDAVCLLTIDSGAHAHRALQAFQHCRDAFGGGDRTVVLDAKDSPDLRNMVLLGHGQYYGHGLSIKPDALIAALRLKS